MRQLNIAAVAALALVSHASATPPMQWRVEDGGNGHWYAISEESGTYWNMYYAAYALKGSLCSITSAAESAFVTAYIAQQSNPADPRGFWVGGLQNYWVTDPTAGWRWESGEQWSFTNWALGEPNDGENQADYLQINHDNSGWNDRPQTVSALALIEWETDCTQDSSRTFEFRGVALTQPAPDGGEVVTFQFDEPPLPAWGNGTCRIRASADLGLGDELLLFRVDGGAWYELNFEAESDCAQPAHCMFEDGWLVPAVGPLTIEIFATPRVSARVCPNAFVEIMLAYEVEIDHDCNNNRVADFCEILGGLLEDCNHNYWADTCELARLPELDCDSNGIIDCCDHDDGASDCDGNGKLDRCDIAANPALDCDNDGRLDVCELLFDGATDVDRNGVLDECDITAGRLEDCNHNGVADLIELADEANDTNGDYELDSCGSGSGDIFVDGFVNSADLSIMLSLWGTTDPRADLNRDGIVGAADVSLMLSAWGPIGICGNGALDPGENCCNCPSDAGCGVGFDCYYGACVPCPSGVCPPKFDDCDVLYGPAAELSSGYNSPCYGIIEPLECAINVFDRSRARGFSMNMLAANTSKPTVMVASLSFLALLAIPRSVLTRWKRRTPR